MPPKILVVEDNRDNREIICEFLSSFGLETITAVNGEEGIQLFNQHRPDLALIDVLLPKVNGLKVCETIKHSAAGKNTPVIMMSALYKTPGLQLEAKTKYGADEYLIKPLDLTGLVNKICEMLGIDKLKLIEQSRNGDEPIGGGPPKAIKTPQMQGQIEQHPALDVLIWMRNGKMTGTYVQQMRNAKRTLYVLDGCPIYVASNLLSETLGKLLVANGKIDENDLARANAAAMQSNAPLSSVLRKLGLLDANALTQALLDETHQRLINALGWFEGLYEISEDASWTEKIKRPKAPLEQLAYQGIKSHYGNERIAHELQHSLPFRIHKLPENLDMVGLIDWDIEELETFALIDGERTFTQIQQLSNQPIEANQRVIFTLFKLGIVNFN